jgi:hypothetical protein
MTLNEAKQQQMKATVEYQTALDKQTKAQAALASAVEAVNEASQQQLPPDGEAADAARDRLIQLEQVVKTARSTLVQTGFQIRRTATALAEAQERTARVTPHAEALQKLDKALQAVKAADAKMVALGQQMQAQLAGEAAALQKLVAEAHSIWAILPGDVRQLDLNPPHQSAQYFGSTFPETRDLLVRVGTVVAAVAALHSQDEAPHSPATAKSRPTWAAAGGSR